MRELRNFPLAKIRGSEAGSFEDRLYLLISGADNANCCVSRHRLSLRRVGRPRNRWRIDNACAGRRVVGNQNVDLEDPEQ